MLADTDAGNVVTAAQGGARFGYRLLPLILVLIPALYAVQELTVRLGIFTGRGHGELIRERFGARWAWLSAASLAAATLGSLVTEFSAVAGIGELYGLSRGLTLPVAALALIAIVLTGSYRRVERVALVIGCCEFAFIFVAWKSRPDLAAVARDAISMPFGDRKFMYLVAAVIGATFNPWMVFYQQSAIADKGLRPRDYLVARWDTAAGAILTQLLTGSVLVAAAASLGSAESNLASIGAISGALTPVLGEGLGRAAFGIGVLGAALVAAIVSSLALAWGLGEVTGYRRSLELRPFEARWFYGVYSACVLGVAALVFTVSDLVWLNIVAQVANAFLLPLVIGLLVTLAAKVLPEPVRLRGAYLWAVLGTTVIVCGVGIVGGFWGLL
jgi:Mn2+/Fe2+ NRAMP family transporter